MELKRASRRPMASANTSADDPAEAARQAAEPPDEHDHGRRDAEVDEVGEAVELGAELGLRLERARQPAVDAVEQGGDHDQRDRHLVALLDRHADGGEAGAQAEQREEIRHQHAHGDLAVAEQQAPAAAALLRLPVSAAAGSIVHVLVASRDCESTARALRARARRDFRSASTVSPPTARWPTATRAPCPGGR